MKAITPVISIILLLMITIAITGSAFFFFMRTGESAMNATETGLVQQIGVFGEKFRIESMDKNRVYIRNTGTTELRNLVFYVDNVRIDASITNGAIASNTVGTAILNDAQLAMLEGKKLKVTSSSASQEIDADFYGSYTIAYWKFDEGSGTTVADSSGNGRDGTFYGSVGPSWLPGKFGSALHVERAYEYALKDWADFAVSTLTIEFWFKPDIVSTGWRDMVGIHEGDITRFHLNSGDNNIMWYNIYGSGKNLHSNVIPVVGQWYHVVGTYDGASARIYVNGELKNSVAFAATDTAEMFYVGNEREVFSGEIDEVRVLNIARSMAMA